ncbi:MAG: type II secretion system F family protein [Candidatus Thiodiazotropha sp.]
MTKPSRLDQYWILGNAFTELACFMESGLSAKQSLDLLYRNERSGKTRRLLEKLAHQMERNPTFSDTLKASMPRIPETIITVIEYYERDDRLGLGLRKVGEYITDIKSLSDLYIPYGSLVYSAFLGLAALIVLTIMMIFVVPQYESLYQEFGTPLPATTQSIIHYSHLFLSYGWMAIIMGIALIYIARNFHFNTRIPGLFIHATSRLLPGLAHKARMRHDVRLLHTMRLLNHLPQPWVPVLTLLESLTHSGYVRDLLFQARNKWTSSKDLLPVLTDTTLFSEKTLALAGQCNVAKVPDELLQELATQYHGKLPSGALGPSWIKPLLTLLMALLIGYIAVAMYLPLFQIGSMI